MAGDDLEELLDRWEEARDQGKPIKPEELCRDRPDLLEELVRVVAELKAADAFLDDSRETERTQTTESPDDSAIGATGFIDRYRDERFLAEGGLGRVFVARDAELSREVALKRLQDRLAGSREGRRRFVLEAEITARLEHPGIVPVYGLGTDRHGQPFYAMRLIRGETLAKTIEKFHAADATPNRDPGERQVALQGLLRAFLATCQTIAYAHSQGVIHRDLKPANVMLGPYGEALVVDWGLAKAVGPVEATDGEEELPRANLKRGREATWDGEVKGSPAYMSPEQAEGRVDRIGTASDIYSLGATLFSLLTGVLPFREKTANEVIAAVRQGRFLPPRRLNPRVPRALEAVCLKAMSLEPVRRYASASELALEVERWLSGEPVLAWREPWYDRLRRWSRRHRVIVASIGAAALMGVAVLAATNGLLRDLARRLDASNVSLREALAEAERNLYARDIDLADRAWWDGEAARAGTLLGECPVDRRGWEWRYLTRRNHIGLGVTRHERPVVAIGLGSDDRLLSIASSDASGYGLAGTIRLATFSPDGSTVAMVTSEAADGVIVADSMTHSIKARFKPDLPGSVDALAFSADGRSIALALVVRGVLNAGSREKLSFTTEFKARLVLHSLETGSEQVSAPFEAEGRPGMLVAPGGGRCFCTVSLSDQVSVHGMRRQDQEIKKIAIESGKVAVSSDGFWIASQVEGNSIKVRELENIEFPPILLRFDGRARSLCFSADGRRLALASDDRTIRVWETKGWRQVSVLRGQSSPADRLAFSADGSRLVSVSAVDSVVWDPGASPEALVVRESGRDHLSELAVGSSIRVAVVAGRQLTWRDPSTGDAREGLEIADVTALASAPQAGRTAVGTGEGSIILLDAEGRSARTISASPSAIVSLAFATNGLRLVSASRGGEIRTWEANSGRELARFQGGPIVGCSSDGELVASGGSGEVVVVASTTGTARQTLTGSGIVRRLAFSPDGSLIAVVRSSSDAAISRDDLAVFETATGRLRYECDDQPSGVSDAIFSLDGTRLVSSDRAGIVLVREASGGQPLLALKGPSYPVLRLAFTADGNRLLAVGGRVDPQGLRDGEAEELTIWDGQPPG